mmetsp:Transcript_30651/g.74024  ORF Transcript_30651/g.74024 Transcript_30651/m.74024 type:complete len:232 (-) Transcript_30651:397-1092(-)
MANVQEGRGILLDGRGDRPGLRPQGLGQPIEQRTSLRLPHPRLLRRIRRHREREPLRKLCHRGSIPRGPMLLRLPDRRREHSQRDVLAVDRYVHQGQCREDAPAKRHRDRPVRAEEGPLGPEVVRREQRIVRRAHDRLRGRGGNLLLGIVLRYLLAQEARTHARTVLLERAHQQGRGSALRLCVPAVFQIDEQAPGGKDRGDHYGCGGDREGVRGGCPPRRAHRHELQAHV